jgi:hypothetical protein
MYNERSLTQISIVSPAYGAILQKNFTIQFIHHHRSVHIDDEETVFNVQGITEKYISSQYETMSSTEVEPGTWFYSLTSRKTNNVFEYEYGIPSFSYMEFVLSEEDILNHRRFNNKLQENSLLQPLQHVGNLNF